jgi:hypothetical protein
VYGNSKSGDHDLVEKLIFKRKGKDRMVTHG